MSIGTQSYPARKPLKKNSEWDSPRVRETESSARQNDKIAYGSNPRAHWDGAIGNHAAVEISPSAIVRRRRLGWDGLEVEIVQVTRRERIESHFHSPVHLLVLGEHGERSEGETLIEGLARSSLHKYGGKFTFIPAGHKYCDWQVPRTLMRSVFFYLRPDKLPVTSATNGVAPRLFFENASLWDTAAKLVRLIEHPGYHTRPYFEALGVVLAHELACLGHTPPPKRAQIRGGLAAWQERTVVAYIEEHLDEQISLAALAELTRLSRFYFCRAFKQSFGLPPHRYHTKCRIERAKALLVQAGRSVTEIGMAVGFSETSSFTAAFRRATGLTPTAYHRNFA